jgi:hypothetical protein
MTISAYPSFLIFASPMTSIERNNRIVVFRQAYFAQIINTRGSNAQMNEPSQKYCGIAKLLRANQQLTAKDRLELLSQQARLAKRASRRQTGPKQTDARKKDRAAPFENSPIQPGVSG